MMCFHSVKGSIEYLGPHGLEKGLLNISNNIAKLNTGFITSYALYILISLIFYIIFYAYFNEQITILIFILSFSIFSLGSVPKSPTFITILKSSLTGSSLTGVTILGAAAAWTGWEVVNFIPPTYLLDYTSIPQINGAIELCNLLKAILNTTELSEVTLDNMEKFNRGLGLRVEDWILSKETADR